MGAFDGGLSVPSSSSLASALSMPPRCVENFLMNESCRSSCFFCFVCAAIVAVIDMVFLSFSHREPELGDRACLGMSARFPGTMRSGRFAGGFPLEPGEDTGVALEGAAPGFASSVGLPSAIEKETTVESLERLATGLEKTRPDEARLARLAVAGSSEEEDPVASIIG